MLQGSAIPPILTSPNCGLEKFTFVGQERVIRGLYRVRANGPKVKMNGVLLGTLVEVDDEGIVRCTAFAALIFGLVAAANGSIWTDTDVYNVLLTAGGNPSSVQGTFDIVNDGFTPGIDNVTAPSSPSSPTTIRFSMARRH